MPDLINSRMEKMWCAAIGKSPLIAAAIHDGHDSREEVSQLFALTDAERLREEDPFTAIWTTVAETRIVGLRSRFEVDLNRPREKAVYREPTDAWGLQVWKAPLSPEVIDRSLAEYDTFYAEVKRILTHVEQQFGHFVVFDLHTYNHRRSGANAPPADAVANPEVNIGTGNMPSERWAPIVECFMNDLQNFDFLGRHLDVRENIKFRGGHFSRWIHETFPFSGCALAIEFKKFFMDEWTGVPDSVQVDAIRQALCHTIPGVLNELDKFNPIS